MPPSFPGGARVRHGVVAGRIGGDAREQRGLVQLEELRALSEVRARRLLDAVRAVPEVDRVQVRGEDAVLAPALLELPGERCLADLPGDRLLVPDVGVLDELLGDRRAALDDGLVPHVRPQRSADAVQVDAVVLEEALVLDRDDRLSHDRGDLLGRDEHAALLAAQDRQNALAVRGVDDGVDVRALLGRIERRDLARDRPHEPEGERDRGQDEEHAEQRGKSALANPAPPGRRPLLSPNSQERKC